MLIKFSPLIAGASGRAADAVASNWKGRAYVRKHVIPHNPQSAAQIAVRESMARCVTLWRSLSTTIKTWLNTYGTGYRMAGYNIFAQKNRALEQVPSALVVVPANPNVPAVAAFAASVAVAEKITVTWTDPVLTGYTKLALILRDQAGAVFSAEILTTLASAETYDFLALTTGHIYDVYGWLYNSTTGVMGTVASDISKTVT